MPLPRPKYARVDPRNPEAFAKCDRCGFWYNRGDLAFQYEWAGTHLYNTGALVCTTGNRCYDKPFEQLRTIILPPDPPPVMNARTENFAYDEQTVRILEYNAVQNPPWGAGPQTLRALQNGIIERLLEFALSTQGTIGRLTDLSVATPLSGAEIMEIVTTTGTPNAPPDGRLTSLPVFAGAPGGTEVMEIVATQGAGRENANFMPLDGRVTSLQRWINGLLLNGTEILEIVMPNNPATGANFQITTATLALYFSSYPFFNTAKILQGSTYGIKTTDTRLLVVAGSAALTTITAPLAATMLVPFPILIKDTTGNAFTNNIDINFTGGEEVDGQSSLVIDQDYGWVTINPILGGGGWYQS